MTWTTLQRSRLSDSICGWQGGSGPPLLMIHGVGMHADYWSNLIPALEKHFSLTVIDMLGHGASTCLAEETPTLANYTDCIAELIHDNAMPTLVVGHSMGAMIAMDLAARFPERISAFAALNAVYQRSDDAKNAVRSRAASITVETDLNVSDTLERWFDKSSDGVNTLAMSACKTWLSEINPFGYRRAYYAFAHHDEPDRHILKIIECAGLFMTGGDEPNSTPAMSRALASGVNQGEYYIVEGARHMMSMTHADEVLDKLVPFLLQHAAN